MGDVRHLSQPAPAGGDVEAALTRMPAEALLDGPPPDGELLLRRTLRRMRQERADALRHGVMPPLTD